MTTTAETFAPTPADREAHAALDDDGNPHSVAEPAARATVRSALATARAALDAHPLLAIGIAAAVGFLVGRLTVGRSS